MSEAKVYEMKSFWDDLFCDLDFYENRRKVAKIYGSLIKGDLLLIASKIREYDIKGALEMIDEVTEVY